MADLLGGKGANLAEMTRLGLPVPAGFTITTEACRAFLATGELPEGLVEEIGDHLRRVERTMGRRFGDPTDPLLLSVRSGARFSMPGMMETVLNIGLTDATVDGLAAVAGDARFAWDSYRRLIQMYGRTVRSIPAEVFESALSEAKRAAGVRLDTDLSADDLRALVARYRQIYAQHTGEEFPQDPNVQLIEAVRAVFASWHTPRARVYRRQEGIPEDLGTAVNVMAMVFGNLGPDSGTGVAFTRDPATGERGCYGDYLSNAQGEDVVAGIRNTVPLSRLRELDPASFDALMKHMSTLEHHYRDMCDIEFTIERGTLWMLQTRIGKRTPAAAFVIAASLLDEGLIDADEALARVTPEQLAQLMFPRFDLSAAPEPIATGVPASPGAATGAVVFDSRRAVETPGPVVLVRRETSPDDLPGMIAAEGILTSHGGKTSHAAVVARGMGKTCVCGADAIDIDEKARTFTVGGVVVAEGDIISIDGSTGHVYLGRVPITQSPVVEALQSGASTSDNPVVQAVLKLLAHADAVRRLGVRANADTPEDAARARALGAAGIGLCRTEHMFLGERRRLVERMILAATDEERQAALAELLPLQRADFEAILAAMDGRPVTIRLLDPPLHEFLPSLAELTATVAPRGARRGPGPRGHAARGRPPHARGEPDAGAARRPSRPRRTRPVRDAGARDRRGHPRPDRGRRRPPAGDHGAARGRRRGDGGGAGGDRAGPGRVRPARHPDRVDDRDTAGRADRGRGGPLGRVLLVRHQRPHADDVGVLSGRRGGDVPPGLPAARHPARVAVRVRRPRGRGGSGDDRGAGGSGHSADAGARRVRRARRRSGVDRVLPRGRAGLRVLLTAAHPDCPARGRPGRAGRAPGHQRGQPVTQTSARRPCRRPTVDD
jgi:pyruvate,orthophosphate dikinase